MSAQDVALARSIFDEVCADLKVAPEMIRRRDEIAHQVMVHLQNGDRSAESVRAKVMGAMRRSA